MNFNKIKMKLSKVNKIKLKLNKLNKNKMKNKNLVNLQLSLHNSHPQMIVVQRKKMAAKVTKKMMIAYTVNRLPFLKADYRKILIRV